jgi:hypothetical protein
MYLGCTVANTATDDDDYDDDVVMMKENSRRPDSPLVSVKFAKVVKNFKLHYYYLEVDSMREKSLKMA